MKEQLLFCCPKCRGALVSDGKSAKCINSHSYDRSKYGYYNLLLGSVGGTHGDNKEMVLARRAFLGEEHYSPLAETICRLALAHTAEGGVVLDVGCGEGYYTDRIERALYQRDKLTRVQAFDISKDAVRELLKKNSRISAVVASAYGMPVSDGSVQTVINAFSPFAREELVRALVPGGKFIMAIPERDHLYELKELLYDVPYKNELKDSYVEGFELIHDERLSFKINLEGAESVLQLFKMTPYAYRTPRKAAERLSEITALECTADFHVYVYKKI